MAEIKQEEAQRELFGEFEATPPRAERLPSLSHAQKPILLSTNIEQAILAVIFLILSFCLVFFLGILRGKSLAPQAAAVRPNVAASAAMTPRAAVVRSNTPVAAAPSTPRRVTAPPSSAKPDLSKPYTIQLVTYKRMDLAERDVAYLRSIGYYSSIIKSGDYFIVCAGQYAGKEEAQADLRFFTGRYKGPFLRSR